MVSKAGLFQCLTHDGTNLFVLPGRYLDKGVVLLLSQKHLNLFAVPRHGSFFRKESVAGRGRSVNENAINVP